MYVSNDHALSFKIANLDQSMSLTRRKQIFLIHCHEEKADQLAMYSRILISRALDFLNHLIAQTKSSFPSLIRTL